MKYNKTIVKILTICIILLSIPGCDFSKNNSSSFGSNILSENQLVIEFLDVGQADCTYISLPNGHTIIIDGGNNKDGELIVEYLIDRGLTKIDTVVATHPHEDHIGGLDDIIDSFEIGDIYMPQLYENDIPTTKTYEDFLDSVEKGGYEITFAKADMVLIDKDNVKLECLAPYSENYNKLNDYSVVLKLTYGENDFLFTGDAEKESEKEMLENRADLSADVLKVAHHGSKSSTSIKFLASVDPEVSIIFCGDDNSYNHPNKDIVALLEKAGSDVYRTDTDGSTIIASDGINMNLTVNPNLSLDGN